VTPRRSFSSRFFFAVALAVAGLAAVGLVALRSGRELGWWRGAATGPGYEVVDGDTIRLDNGGRVRYIGIDAPERGEAFYDDARRYNQELLARGPLRLAYDRERSDRYGRTLAYVFVRGDDGRDVFVNEELVRAGWARTMEVYPNVGYAATFRAAEAKARRRRRGMWARAGGSQE